MASRTKTRTAASNAVEVSESNKRALEEISEAVLAVGDVIVLEAVVDKKEKFVTAEAVVNEVNRVDLTFEQWRQRHSARGGRCRVSTPTRCGRSSQWRPLRYH